MNVSESVIYLVPSIVIVSSGRRRSLKEVNLSVDVVQKALQICREEGINYVYPARCIEYIINRYDIVRKMLGRM